MSLAEPVCLRRSWLSRACLMARAARVLSKVVLDRVPVSVRLATGERWGGSSGDPQAPAMQIDRPLELFERVAHHPKIGIGEGYMAGDWSTADGTDLADLLFPFAERLADLIPKPLLRLRGFVDQQLPHTTRNTVGGAKRNIEAHYDLSNELFERFLDPTLSYSSGLFDPALPLAEQPLERAQERKIERALDAAGVGPGTRLLEIGSGWGALAIAAGRRGARVTSITLSAEQKALADERIAAAGLADTVEVRIQDYRETSGTYDAIISIEMLEAVGEEYWPTYFSKLDSLLTDDGIAVVQVILMQHERYLATRHSYGWIQKYIFPGGLIPSLRAIESVVASDTGLAVTSLHAFGRDYAETLRRWREAFNANWEQIEPHGFDEHFRRRWEFYLAYCQAGFASGYLDVAQIEFRHTSHKHRSNP